MSDENGVKAMGQVIQIDEARIRDHLGEMVRGTVEETLNALLDAEADQLCGAGRYERSEARQDTRAGSYERTLQTKAGDVNLKIPKLRRQTFETAIIERYRRRESSVEEALIEMYLAGISVRRVEDITEALWGTRVSPSTVSNLNKKIYAKIEAWRNRRIEGEHPYLYLDGIVMKRTWAGEVRNVSLLVASAVNSEGFREILGICEGAKEDKSGWSAFLRHLVVAAVEAYPDVPIVMHQDHGASPDVCMGAIRSGFTSVMMDGSLKDDAKTPADYAYNVAVTHKVVGFAHAVGVSVEAELGCLGSLETLAGDKEDGHGAEGKLTREQLLTDPDEAARFVDETQCDALAIAIGALYGGHLKGASRWIYAVTAMTSFYFNVFVLVVQLFRRVPALAALAPTQTEPPFAAAQIVVLLVFAALTVRAVMTFHPKA